MHLLKIDYKKNNKLCTYVSLLLELEYESMTMFAKIWSSARSACSVYNVNHFSNGKVLVVSTTLPFFLIIDACPSLIYLVVFLVLNQKEYIF